MLRTFIYFSIAIYKRSDRLRRRAGRISESFFSDSLACRKYTHSQSQREAETFHRSAFYAIRCEEKSRHENIFTAARQFSFDNAPSRTRFSSRPRFDFPVGYQKIENWKQKSRLHATKSFSECVNVAKFINNSLSCACSQSKLK